MYVILCFYMLLICKFFIRWLFFGNEEFERSCNNKVIKNKMEYNI